MTFSPVMEWRAAITPFAVITNQAFTGSGFAGAIPVGTNSGAVTIRLYNNFAAAASIADALNCTLACYDDTVHQGIAINPQTTGLYTQIQVLDYNGVTTGADALYYAIGGQTKHALPTNSGTVSGSGANYVEVSIRISIPANATQGSAGGGLWVEYSSTS
jgi:hypothetical protein